MPNQPVFSIPIIGYAYSLFEKLPNDAPVVRFVAVPIMVLTCRAVDRSVRKSTS